MTRHGIEPRSPGVLVNTLLIRPMARLSDTFVRALFLRSSKLENKPIFGPI